MEIASEYVSNWGGYRSFQQALEVAGWKHFPTLKIELPESNGGITRARDAAKMLRELRVFAEEADLGSKVVLVDEDSGEEIQEYIAAYAGVFLFGASGVDIGVDEKGVFIRRRSKGTVKEVFRSNRFERRFRDMHAIAQQVQARTIHYEDVGKSILDHDPARTAKTN